MILVTADLHFTDNPRDDYRHKFQRWLRDTVRERKPNLVIILGDLTEAKDYHSASLVNKVVDHIYRLSRLAPVIILRGNHDGRYADNAYWAFLHRIDGVSWIGEPRYASDLEYAAGAGLKGLFLPHSTSPTRDWAGLDLNQPLIFAHNTFAGADGGRGRKLAGIEAPFPPGASVVSGDVHIPQTFGKITYVGAPYTVDFGDDFNPRLLMVVNGGTSNGGLWRLKSIPCEGPQKRLVEINAPTELAKQRHLYKGDIVKVRLKIAAGDYPRWPEWRDKIYAWCEKRGLIAYPQAVFDTKPKARLKKVVDVKTDEELLTAYAKRQGLDAATLKTGLNLMRRGG